MKKIIILSIATLMLVACTNSEEQLRQRAAELCQYIPDHALLEKSKDYMTQDFYAVVDTMFNQLPAHEAMNHEWLYYFVTSNGGTIADYEVVSVEQIDKTHAVATISVRQKWEDGSFDPTSDIEEHKLYMEKVEGKWLMADFDGRKQDCINYIANNRKEQALRDAISDYLVKEIGTQYSQGEICIPVLMIVAAEEVDSATAHVWGNHWIYWYNRSDDTLKTVSGGNHSGCMTIQRQGDALTVTAFEQTTDGAGFEASAKRIFGKHYEIFQNMQNADIREAVRKEQLQEYVKRNRLNIHYFQDYGWEAVALTTK